MLLLTNATVDCFLHLYSPNGGGHLVEEMMGFSSNGVDFDLEVLGGNFTELGQYAILFYCNEI